MTPFKSLERKLASGKTLEQAALEAGLEVDAAREYLAQRRTSAAETEDDTLLLFSNEALRTAMNVLKRATRDPDRIKSETFDMGGTTFALTDIEAAKALLTAGLAARKMLYSRKTATSKMQNLDALSDLFDRTDPWEFKGK